MHEILPTKIVRPVCAMVHANVTFDTCSNISTPILATPLFPSGTTAGSAYDVHMIRGGLNYKLGSPTAYVPDFTASQTQFPNWEVHGQTTYIQQGYPAFRSPYLGVNSFTPWAQTRETWSRRSSD